MALDPEDPTVQPYVSQQNVWTSNSSERFLFVSVGAPEFIRTVRKELERTNCLFDTETSEIVEM